MIPQGHRNQITDQGLFALKTGNTFMFLIFHEGTVNLQSLEAVQTLKAVLSEGPDHVVMKMPKHENIH